MNDDIKVSESLQEAVKNMAEVIEDTRSQVEDATGERFPTLSALVAHLEQVRPDIGTMEPGEVLGAISEILEELGKNEEAHEIYRTPITSSMLFTPSAVYRELKRLEPGGEGLVNVGKSYGKKKQEVMVAVSLEGLLVKEGFDLDRNLSSLDFIVHDHIMTLYWSGKTVFTISDICKMIYNRDGDNNYRPSRTFEEKVTESIERLRRTRVNINYTREAKAHGLPVDKMIRGRELVHLELITVKSKGRTIEAYRAFHVPPVLEYATINGQLGTYPRALLDLPGGGKNKVEQVAIAQYIAERVEYMANKKGKGLKYQNKILIDTVIEECRVEVQGSRQAQSQKKKRVIKTIEDALKINPKVKSFKRAPQGSNDGYMVNIR